MNELNQSLLQRLECPACLDYMSEKIFLCKAGHSSCGKCKVVLKECPICRGGLSNLRNYDLEAVAELLHYPCKFVGCEEFIQPDEIERHYRKCDFRPYPCMLKLAEGFCDWSGRRGELERHALANHDPVCWMKEDNLDRWKDGSEEDDMQVELIRAHEELFYMYRSQMNVDDDPIKSIMYWSVQYIGPPEDAQKYIYKINVYSEKTKRDLSFYEICQDDRKNMTEMINSGMCVGIPLKILQSFKNKYNSVWYKVKIELNEEQENFIQIQ